MVSDNSLLEQGYISGTASFGTEKKSSAPSFKKRFKFDDEQAEEPNKKQFPRESQTSVASEQDEKEARDSEFGGTSTTGTPGIILQKVSWISSYTDEYLSLKRKGYINNILTQAQRILKSFDDVANVQIGKASIRNEILAIYKKFISSGNDAHFLSIISMIEDALFRHEFNKKILKECFSFLNTIKNKQRIEYLDYQALAKRFFEQDIDVVNIRETTTEA